MRDKNREEAERWWRQAERDLKAAKDSMGSEDFEWACFQCQQSAEKALKAYLYSVGKRLIFSHSILDLVRSCSKLEKSFIRLEKEAKELDHHYLPTRYPNTFARGSPYEYYSKEDADQCINYAQKFVKKVKEILNF